MNNARKFANAYQSNGGRIFYHAAPMKRGKYIISRNYRRKRKHLNEIAFQSRKRNRH